VKIAIVSDSHGRIRNIAAALAIIAERHITTLLHCGDIDDAATVPQFPAGTHFVFGNCDLDRNGIERAIVNAGGYSHGAWGQVEVEGRAIAFTHGDDKTLLRELENSAAFDFIFYGHTHIAAEHRTGKTRVINPGALHRASPKSFAILDVTTGTLERVEVEGE
jgi:putative phosphoesterase